MSPESSTPNGEPGKPLAKASDGHSLDIGEVVDGAPVSTAGTPEGRRIIELLWAAPSAPTRGPRPKLSLSEIIDAAISLADADGFEALSMRSLARHLGVGAMSLYTYVPGKSELFELMIDRAYAGRSRPDSSLPWRERYTAHVREALVMYRRHPWLLESILWRLPLGPNVLDVSEDQLRIGHDAGLSRAMAARVASLMESYAFGIARGEIADQNESRRTGQTADDYWNARAGFWETYFDPKRYSATLATWEAGAYEETSDSDADLTLAVDLILDSIERLVAGTDDAP